MVTKLWSKNIVQAHMHYRQHVASNKVTHNLLLSVHMCFKVALLLVSSNKVLGIEGLSIPSNLLLPTSKDFMALLLFLGYTIPCPLHSYSYKEISNEEEWEESQVTEDERNT